jgi:hypothetical protein
MLKRHLTNTTSSAAVITTAEVSKKPKTTAEKLKRAQELKKKLKLLRKELAQILGVPYEPQ